MEERVEQREDVAREHQIQFPGPNDLLFGPHSISRWVSVCVYPSCPARSLLPNSVQVFLRINV